MVGDGTARRRIEPSAVTDGTETTATVTGEPSAVAPSTLRAYRESAYRVFVTPPLTLRIDRCSAGLRQLHATRRVRSSAFVTACNPLGPLVDARENAAREARLVAELERSGTPFVPGIGEHPAGGWPGEPSVLALGLDLEAACALGRRHAQNAILWSGADAVPRLVLLR